MLSPRTANYERIEGGMGPSRGMPPKQRFAWKKIAIGAAVLIGLVYFFGPREKSSLPWSDSNSSLDEDIEGECVL